MTCALCHSSVDDSFAPGIGKRLDGWANTDLNVGAIVALSPALDRATKAEFSDMGARASTTRDITRSTGRTSSRSTEPSVPIVIPPIYGLKGVGFETFTGDGPISYWNSYVGVGQMGGQGTFNDPRIGLFINQTPDLVTPKLPALLDYQLSLRTPQAPSRELRSSGRQPRPSACFATRRGAAHVIRVRTFTDVLSGRDRSVPFLHDAAEVGTDPTLRRQIRHRPVSDDALARTVAASALFPRWQRARP